MSSYCLSSSNMLLSGKLTARAGKLGERHTSTCACRRRYAVQSIHHLSPRQRSTSSATVITNAQAPQDGDPPTADVLFVATNNFKVKQEYAEDFESMWKNRESHLNESPGFIRFALLRCDVAGEYVSQTYWASRNDFEKWTKSQQFSKAHQNVKPKSGAESGDGPKRPATMDMLEGPPTPKLYEAVTVTEKELF